MAAGRDPDDFQFLLLFGRVWTMNVEFNLFVDHTRRVPRFTVAFNSHTLFDLICGRGALFGHGPLRLLPTDCPI